MKKGLIIFLLFAALVSAALSACGGSKDDPIVEPEEEILIDTTLIVPPAGSTHTFTILSHAAWKAEVVQGSAWCKMTPTSAGSGGATIAVTVGNNDEFAVRKALIKIESSIGKGTIEVIQQQIDVLDLTVDDSCDFGPQGGSFAVNVDYNIDYRITCDADWVRQIESKALQHATLLFAVDKNNTGGERSCRLTFEGSGITNTITVYQEKAYIQLSIDDIALGDADTYLPIMVESNVSYNISMPEAEWISFEGNTHSGTDGEISSTRFDFSLQENTEFFLRECKVAFGNPEYHMTDTLHILQRALDILYEAFPLEGFGPEGGSFSFDVDPTEEYQITTGEATWIVVSIPDDMPWRRVVTVEKNMTGEDRTGGVKITRGSRSKTLDVVQAGAHIDFSAERFAFSSMGGSQTLNVTGNVEYEVAGPSDAPWCTVEEGSDGVFTITAARNNEETGRECALVFTNGEYKLSYVITIAQAQLDAFEVAPASFSVIPQGDRIEVAIHTNVEFECVSDADWITEDIPARTAVRRVYVVARNSGINSREGHLVFNGAGMEQTVTVVQAAGYLTASPRSFEFDDAAGSGDISVTGNIDFRAKVIGDAWLSITEITTEGVLFSLSENNDWGNRTGRIVIYNDDYEAADTVMVYQGAKYYLDIEQTEFSLPPQGGQVALKVTSNKDYDYHIADSPEWISEVSPLTFEISPNTGSQAREAYIVFEQNGLQKSVIITQDAPYLVVDKPQIEFSAAGGEATVSVSGNIPFASSVSDADWILCERESASTFAITAAVNDNPQVREGVVTFSSAEYGCSVQVQIIQAEKGLFELLTESFSFGPMGDLMKVEVNTNVDYTYSIDADWIEDEGNLAFTVIRNISEETRVGTIVFSANGCEYTVTVEQEGALLAVTPEQLLFAVEGGENAFTVSANIHYEIVVPNEGWFTCTEGDEGSYLVTVTTNDGDTDRESIIAVQNEDFERIVYVAVVQPRSDFFNLLTPEFSLGPDTAEIEIGITTNMEYTYSVSADWVETAGDLNFSVARNTGSEGRECTITFTAADETYEVTIVQDAPYLTLSQQSFQVDSIGGQISLGVTSNVEYEIDMPESDWIECTDTLDGPIYVFDVSRIDDYESRSYSVSFSATNFGLAATASITQRGNESLRPFSVAEHDYFVGPTGGELIIEHTECNNVEVSTNAASWLRELTGKRTSTHMVFSVDTSFSTSTRQAVLSVRGNGRAVTTYVFQNPPLLVIADYEKSINAKGGTASISIVSNFTPQFYTDADWVTGSVSEDGKSIIFTAERNETGEERVAEIEVGLRSHEFVKTVTITQPSTTLVHITPSELNVGFEGGEFYITIDINAQFSVTTGAPWVTCTATGENSQYIVTVAANSNAADRSTNIGVYCEDKIHTVAVKQQGYRNPDYYYSEDFSQHLHATRIQAATEGDGIPLVLMGDAFSDRLIADGTYDRVMRKTAEAVFDIEPYKSFRNLFDVWYVKIVSMNEIYAEDAATALNTKFVQGTVVTGNHNAVQQIAVSLLDAIKIKNAAIIVLMNTETYGGATYLYDFIGEAGIGDYGEGMSIAYIPLCTSEEQFTQVVQHEVGGHGIGKLEDEYYYAGSGEIPMNKVDSYKVYQSAGFYKNVDFISDPEQVLWAKFLADEDYQYDGLGVFEGACIYATGAYRATEESMMYHNEGPFNAPSREAIYYRLHKLAYGDSWEYDYDAFKQYDAINRKTSRAKAQSQHKSTVTGNPLCPEPLPAPVFIK